MGCTITNVIFYLKGVREFSFEVEIVFAKKEVFTHPSIPSKEGRIAKTIATKSVDYS